MCLSFLVLRSFILFPSHSSFYGHFVCSSHPQAWGHFPNLPAILSSTTLFLNIILLPLIRSPMILHRRFSFLFIAKVTVTCSFDSELHDCWPHVPLSLRPLVKNYIFLWFLSSMIISHMFLLSLVPWSLITCFSYFSSMIFYHQFLSFLVSQLWIICFLTYSLMTMDHIVLSYLELWHIPQMIFTTRFFPS